MRIMKPTEEVHMSDFLKNLRNTGKDNRSLKRPSSTQYNSTRYHYESQKKQFAGDKRNGQDRRREVGSVSKSQESIASSIVEITPAIIEFMEIMAKSRIRLAEAEEQKARAEERKADAIENILKELKETGIESLLGLQAGKKKKKVKKPFDQHRKKILQLIAKLRNKGETFDEIALHLQKENLKTFSGRGQWHAQTVHRLYQDYILE